MISIIVIAILMPLAVILVVILLFNRRNYNLKKLLNQAKEKTSEQREHAIETSLKRISIIAQSNSNIIDIFHELDIIYKNFMIILTKLRHLTKKLSEEIHKMKFSVKQSKIIYHQIYSEYPMLDQIEDKFNSLAEQIIAQDEILRKEFHFYQKHLREIVNIYKEKRVLLDIITSKISNFNQSIKYIEKQFEKVIDKGDNTQASILIQRYIQKIVTFSKIVSSGPALAMQIKIQIPNVVKKLTELYLSKKKESRLPVNLDYIDFQKSLKNISKQFNQAQKFFLNFNIDRAIDKIKDVLKGFKMIENQINLEVKSKNACISTYEKIINEAKSTLNKWVSINKQFKEIAGSGKIMNPELIESYNNVKTIVDNLDKDAINYRSAMKNKKLPYSVKIQRAIFLIEGMQNSINKINNFMDNIWEIDLENVMVKNKFSRAENAIHEIISLSKQENIILSISEYKKITDVLKQKAVLAKILKGNINNHVKFEIDKFSIKITKLYSLISSKVQMAFHIKNLIKEFSSRRAIDLKLNLGLKQVETKYLEGDYISGLNEVINCIKETNAI